MRTFVPFVATGVMILLLAACSSNTEPDTVEFSDIVVYDGTMGSREINFPCLFQASVAADGSVLQGDSMFVVIRDQSDWAELWEYVLEDGRRYPSGLCSLEGEPPLLDVDFDDQMAILIVEVQPSSGYAIRIDQVVATGGAWTVEATRTTPCCGVRATFTYPHQIIATEQFDGEVALVVTELVGGTPPGAP